MKQTITAAGYIIQDINGDKIYGVGQTLEQAKSMVIVNAGPFFNSFGDEIPYEEAFDKYFPAYEATQALIDLVMVRGGAISWGKIDNVACTRDEEEAANA